MKKLLLLILFPVLLFAQQVDPGFGQYRNTALSSTKQTIKTSSCNLYGFTIVNPNAAPVYVKLYNGTTSTVTVGTTAPTAVVEVPANDGTNNGAVIFAPGTVSYRFFSSGLVVAAVTGLADNSTAAPGTAIYMEALYK